jgi:3-oxoacyl-[acyl-carrier-protein] synthase III
MMISQRSATNARILSFGHYQPARVVGNDDLVDGLGTSDEWIRSRVGIASRRIAGSDESVLDMAVAAGGKALAASGLDAADIDLVIVASCTTDSPMPAVAPQVADRLSIVAPGAYDVNAACAGFCYALAVAADAVRVGSANNVLVIGSDKMSSWLDWSDRTTCILFGDGAGAAVVSAGGAGGSIGPVVWGSAGDKADKIMIRSRDALFTQDGQAVYRWATTEMVPVSLEACRQAGVSPSELAAFVPHQGNLRMVRALARGIGADRAEVADCVVDSGNTCAASVPLALSRMSEQGRLRSGGLVLVLGFGAGLTYAAQVITAP